MFTVVITEKGGAQRRAAFDKNEVTIGRVQGNDVILPKGNVSKRHSRIVFKDNRFIVVDLKSTNGTYVNGRKITSPLVVKPGDKIYIGDFILTLEDAGVTSGPTVGAAFEPPPPEPPRRPGPPPLRQQTEASIDAAPPGGPPPAPAVRMPPGDRELDHTPPPGEHERFALDEEPSAEVAPAPRITAPRQGAALPAPPASMSAPPAAPLPVPSVPAGPLSSPPAGLSGPTLPPSGGMPRPAPVPSGRRTTVMTSGPVARSMQDALRVAAAHLGAYFDLDNVDGRLVGNPERLQQAQSAVESVLLELTQSGAIDGGLDQAALGRALTLEAAGLGAIDELVRDESVREIVVEAPGQIVADRGEGLAHVDAGFSSASAVLTVARRLASQAGAALLPSEPVLDAVLPDGMHLTVVQPPVAVRGTIIELRRLGIAVSAEELAERGMLTIEALDVLRLAVERRRGILVAGAGGAGVTTFLGALAGLAPSGERVVTVEHAPELAIARPHVLSLCAGSAGSALGLGAAIEQACRLHVDRLVVDGVRGPEALDALTAASGRHAGALIGMHLPPDRAPLAHLATLARLGRSADAATVAELLAGAVHVVVELARGDDGVRRVTAVSEVRGTRGTAVETDLLFALDDGALRPTGKAASFL